MEAEIPDVVGAREAGERAGEDGGAGDDELMALLGVGEGIGATGMAEAAGGSAIEPTEGRKIRQIGQRKGEGIVAGSREIEDLEGFKPRGIVGVEG